jgi:hypothetical protein
MNNMNDMSELLDNRDQYRLYRKHMLKHFKTYFVLNLKHIITNRKMFYFKRLIIVLSIGVLTYCLITAKKVPQVIEGRTIYVSDETKTMESFLEKLGQLESNSNYRIVNRFGYMGKYQISQTTLASIGLNINKDVFLSTPKLQEVAMQLLMKYNKNILSSYIGKYQNRTINEIYITESGLLAGAHLGGAGSVIKFLTKGEDFKDGNNVSVSKYIKKFGGYKVSFN